MKKLIVILIFAGLSLAGYSQVRTLTPEILKKKNVLKVEETYFSYTGVAADSLSVFQDTIQMQITVNKNYPYAVSLRSAFDTIDGADTLVYINVLGKVYEDDSWSSIIADSSAAVSAAANKTVTNWTSNIYTITADTTAISVDSVGYYSYNVTRAAAVADNYRYLLIQYIIAGDDSTGEGVLLKKLELNLIRKE